MSRCPWELWGKPDGETVMDHVFGEEALTQQVTCCTSAEMETLRAALRENFRPNQPQM